MLFFQQKKNVSFVVYLSHSISVALFLFEFRWPAAFSLFLCLSLALYSKFVDMTINLSLILQKTRIQKQFPLFGFVFIDSLVASALQTRVAMRFPAKITSSFMWVIIRLIELFHIGMPWCGRTVGSTVTGLPNFVGWVDYHIFLPMVLRCALFAHENSATIASVLGPQVTQSL